MIKLNPLARLTIPDGKTVPDAISRTTHLGIGAHQDDLEFMAFHGILACYDKDDRWFGGVTITDGRGSSRAGKFKEWSDEQIAAERIREQEAAAVIGQYSFIAQLGFNNAAVRDAQQTAVRDELRRILESSRPEIVYLHNLADKHDTHVGCALRCIEAIRQLPQADRPKRVYGCEVWRDLDWLVDTEKTPMPISARPELARALNEVFATQIAGGKRYDLAVLGRRTANATFSNAHSTDQESAMQWAMDLTPLAQDDSLDPIAYTVGFIDRLKADVTSRLRKSL
ncbi:MAG: PIG-L family deacetylase [Opitutales bacterium]|nr:PIG-L family deacetylase [Opitutales bacterium]